jgi:hypothetical protein
VAKYRMTKETDQFTPSAAVVEMKGLLSAAFPLRYPPSLVEAVNVHLKTLGLTWDPSARVERWDREDEYDDYLAEQHGEKQLVVQQGEKEITFTITPDEIRKTVDGIMQDMKKEVLHRLGVEGHEDASHKSSPGKQDWPDEPPF